MSALHDGSGPPVVSLEDVHVVLGGTEALRGVGLVTGPAPRIAVIGPSGAGKTTLLRVLAGVLFPARGRATVLGATPSALGRADLRRFRARVGFVHQSHALVPTLRVVQNVAAGRLAGRGAVRGLLDTFWPRGAAVEEIHAVLERVGIGDLLFRRTDRLSGGERQRVAVARTLYQAPDLLLADEPVASVDPERARSIVELLVSLSEERRLPLVASLHDVDLATAYFDRVVGLRSGRVAFDHRAGEGPSRAELAALYATDVGSEGRS